MLATRAGTDLTYRQIYDVVHGEGFCAGDGEAGYRVNVRSLIKRIRQKFHSIDPSFDEIENYPGFGYRWHARTGVDAVSSAMTERKTESLGAPTMKRADAHSAGQITA
jgi:two-component system response regulator ChvI